MFVIEHFEKTPKSTEKIKRLAYRVIMKNNIHAPKLSQIRITDPLFGRYAALVAEQMIPYQWEALNDRVPGAEKSHCIENFRIAAGELKGTHGGIVFGDTDAYKWLEAVAYCIENGSGAAYEKTADELIALIGRAQQSDGYLNTYYTIDHPGERWTNLTEGHELYSAGHMIEAAVAYHQATGKDAFLNIACRFADLIDTVFGPQEGKHKGYCGHQEIELALMRLYGVTGETRYRDLAAYFIEIRGHEPNYLLEERKNRKEEGIFPEFRDYDAAYAQTHLPAKEQTTAEGHAVRAMYMYSAMADIARECGDDAMKNACKALWESVTKKRMYITGGIGSSGHLERFTVDYDLPNDRMYCETCASVGLMMFGQRMASLTKHAKYYDTVERALCNTVLSGISASGNRYFYVNPLEVWPENCLPSTSMSHVMPVRQPWFACSCCPPNAARTLASLGQYIYAQDDKSIYINQFISSTLRTSLQDAEVALSMEADYMQSGSVRISVEAGAHKPFTVRVRVPEYIKKPMFYLDGTRIAPVIESGYAVLAVSRAGKQQFELRGEVRPVFVAANRNVRADAGRVALTLGPYVYCLEQADNGGNLACVYADIAKPVASNDPQKGLPGPLPQLGFEGFRLTRSLEKEDALYGEPQFEKTAAHLTATPYCLWGNRESGEMLVWMKALI